MPGSWNVTRVTHLPSGGGSGIVKGGDQGEFANARESVHVFIWSGLNTTAEAFPRYTIHDNRRPGPLDQVCSESPDARIDNSIARSWSPES